MRERLAAETSDEREARLQQWRDSQCERLDVTNSISVPVPHLQTT